MPQVTYIQTDKELVTLLYSSAITKTLNEFRNGKIVPHVINE